MKSGSAQGTSHAATDGRREARAEGASARDAVKHALLELSRLAESLSEELGDPVERAGR
jgi:hypothetical protein